MWPFFVFKCNSAKSCEYVFRTRLARYNGFFNLFFVVWNTSSILLHVWNSCTPIISLRLGFRRNFLSVLHPNLVSSPIKGILEIFNLTTRCIPMGILAWTDCVRSSAGKISYIDIFSSSNLQKYWYFLTFYTVYPTK